MCIQLQRNEIKNSNSEKVWKNCEQGHPKILASSKIIVPELLMIDVKTQYDAKKAIYIIYFYIFWFLHNLQQAIIFMI